jgi:hypothetical protein
MEFVSKARPFWGHVRNLTVSQSHLPEIGYSGSHRNGSEAIAQASLRQPDEKSSLAGALFLDNA